MADFGSLRVLLNTTGLAKDNPTLYQFLNSLLDSSTQLNAQTITFIGGGGSSGGGSGTGITGAGTAGRLAQWTAPSSIGNASLPANVGTFGDASHVPQVTIDSNGLVSAVVNIPLSAAIVDYVVMSDGSVPPNPMDDGGSNFIYITYTP